MADREDQDLVEAAQPNELLRRVDALCERRAWDDLVDLALRCRQAVERGKQLWPIAEHIDYRLALEGPARYAASVLGPDAGRFALGPLTEVASSTHTYDELRPHLESPLVIGVVGAERAVRGEDLTGRNEAWQEVMDLPLALQPWEPSYPLAVYRASKIHAPGPELRPALRPGKPESGEAFGDPELEGALLDLVGPWVAASNGACEVGLVDGPAEAAIAATGCSEFRIGPIAPEDALAAMAWAAASGGAFGRRRGAAAGRSAAWWAVANMLDMDWPLDPDAAGGALGLLRWYWFEPAGPQAGWTLYLAVEDPGEGWSVAIRAEDRAG